jgi:hypothetical protein
MAKMARERYRGRDPEKSSYTVDTNQDLDSKRKTSGYNLATKTS